MAVVSALTSRSLTVLMHRPQENIWVTVAHTGTRTPAVTLTVTPTVILTAITVATIATGTGTPTVATTATGVTVVVPLSVVDVTHLIIGSAGATREARLEEAALARNMMGQRVTELRALPTRKMAAGGKRGLTSTSVVACTVFSQVMARARGFKLVQRI